MARTIVALYDRADDARRAYEDLLRADVPRDDISLVSTRSAQGDERYEDAGTVIGATLGGIGGAMVAMAALTIPGIGALIAAGPIAAGLVGAGAGAMAGGLIGSLTHLGVPEHEVHALAEQVERGGTLLLVHADGAEDRVTEVLSRHPPVDVRTRGAADGKDALAGRGADWRTAAWTPFDQSAGPMEVLRPQQASGGDPSQGAHRVAHQGDRSGADWQAAAREPGGEEGQGTDAVDTGQPGTSPGTRGAATAFGGIERKPEAAKPAVKAP